MSINAVVAQVHRNPDGSGFLQLTGEERGQERLRVESAPHEVAKLQGKQTRNAQRVTRRASL